jgi:hypothetical protein
VNLKTTIDEAITMIYANVPFWHCLVGLKNTTHKDVSYDNQCPGQGSKYAPGSTAYTHH